MWSGSKVAGLLNSKCKWIAHFSTHANRQIVQYVRDGKEHIGRTYGIALEELSACQVKRGWIWDTVELVKADGHIFSFPGLRSDAAAEFADNIESAIEAHINKMLVGHQQALRQMLERAQSFQQELPAFDYQKIYDFVTDFNTTLHEIKQKISVVMRRTRTETIVEAKQLSTLSNDIENLIAKIEQTGIAVLSRCISESINDLEALVERIRKFAKLDRYLRTREIRAFRQKLAEGAVSPIGTAYARIEHPYAEHLLQSSTHVKELCNEIRSACNTEATVFERRNERFIEQEKRRGNPALSKLNDEQQTGAIALDDTNLLVASAGSGKSWTIVGKAGYVLTRDFFKPNDILALSFNAEAADELNTKFKANLRPYLGKNSIKAHTFHALGMTILRKKARQEHKRLKVFGSSRKTERGEANRAVAERALLIGIVDQLKAKDASFLRNWLIFRTQCRQPSPTADVFTSYQDYVDYVEEQRKVRKNGKPAFLQTMDNKIVRSVEELAICNWLWMHGATYEYERDFTPKPEGWDKLTPDFFFPDIDTWYEHFGLDEYGRAPHHFNDPERYEQLVGEKGEWFDAHVEGRWFSTRSAHYRTGELFSFLEAELKRRGLKLIKRSTAEVEAKIKTLRQIDEINLISKILHSVRGNGYSKQALARLFAGSNDPYRTEVFTDIFWPIHDAYETALKLRREIDFDDMIVSAAKVLEKGEIETLPYKLIMVDEFQDISPGRARLLKALLAQHPDSSILFAVGDDWQAINGFAGSDLGLFMDFEREFGKGWEGPLSTTFRCAQGIADVSSWFVMQNAYQKTKDVQADKNHTINGVVELIDFYNDESSKNGTMSEIERVVGELAASVTPPASPDDLVAKISVFVLGRYRLKNMTCIDKARFDLLTQRYSSVIKLTYKTAHSSKGLEADYVFCVGVNRGKFRNFPSTFGNDPLVEMLLPKHDSYPNAEERRLFYVALTRAKRKVFVLFQKDVASPFVLELMEPKYTGRIVYRGNAVLPRLCKTCSEGYMIDQKSSKSGNPFRGCSRYKKDHPNSCDYKEDMHGRPLQSRGKRDDVKRLTSGDVSLR